MKINAEIIRNLDPCKSRFNNYLNHYPDFDGDLAQFLSLDKITYDDKAWVGVRLMTRKQYSRWAAICALSVVHIYEEKFPGDSRPRDAIEAVLSGKPNDEIIDAAYAAARAAARAAADAAYAAADAAGAADAASAASAAAYAARAAACAAADAAYAAARKEQENKNLQLMLDAVESEK